MHPGTFDKIRILRSRSSSVLLLLHVLSACLSYIYQDCLPETNIIYLATKISSISLFILILLRLFHYVKLFNQKVTDCLARVEPIISVIAGCWWIILLLVAVLTTPLQMSNPVHDFVCGALMTIPRVVAIVIDCMTTFHLMVADIREKYI